jgi:hypothetical protein
VEHVGWDHRDVARTADAALRADPHDDLAADDPEHLVTEMGAHRTATGVGGQAAANHHEALEAVRASGNHLEAALAGSSKDLKYVVTGHQMGRCQFTKPGSTDERLRSTH